MAREALFQWKLKEVKGTQEYLEEWHSGSERSCVREPGVQRGADRPGWGTGGGTREGRWSDVQLEEQPGWLCRACGPWRGLEALSRREGEAGNPSSVVTCLV